MFFDSYYFISIFYAFYNGYITIYIYYTYITCSFKRDRTAGNCMFKHGPLKVEMLISEKSKSYFGHFHCKSNQNIPYESAFQTSATISNLSIVNGRWDFHFDHSQELLERSLIPQERRNASMYFVWTARLPTYIQF